MSTTGPADGAEQAAQEALAGEHAAIYAYGVVGGVVAPTGPDAAVARAGYDEHVRRRDLLEQRLRQLDAEPVAAEPGYALPAPVTSVSTARTLARRVEDRCAVLHAALVAAATGDLRAAAVGWLAECATRGLAWGAPATAFPGLDPA